MSFLPGLGSLTGLGGLTGKAQEIATQAVDTVKSKTGIDVSIPGVGDKNPTTIAAPAPSPRDTSFFKGGENYGKVYLIFLTLLPFIGSFGVNLVAVDATAWGAAKAATQGLLTLGAKFFRKLYPRSMFVEIYGYLLSYMSPWYWYDIAQVFNPNFIKEGFKIPFAEKPIGVTGDEAYLNMKVLSAIFLALSLGGLQILEWLPESITGKAKPWIQFGIAAVGGVAALSTGGIAGLPAMVSAYKAWKGTMAGGGAGSQQGGGGKSDIPGNYTGSGIPSLRVIAGTLLGPNPAGDSFPYASDTMSGGGYDAPSKEVAALGLGALAFVTLAGISLALIRSKGEGGSLAE